MAAKSKQEPEATSHIQVKSRGNACMFACMFTNAQLSIHHFHIVQDPNIGKDAAQDGYVGLFISTNITKTVLQRQTVTHITLT